MQRPKSKLKKEDPSSSRNSGESSGIGSASPFLTSQSIRSPHRSPNRSPSRTGHSTPSTNNEGVVSIKREELTPSLERDHSSATVSINNTLGFNTARGKESVQERRAQLFSTLGDVEGKHKEKRQTFHRFFALLLPILLDVYSASVGVQVRTKTFQSMLKIVQYCDKDYLPTILAVREA